MLWGRGMNLHDEKWPFAVAFLLSLLGWHITQLTDEVRSAITVLYSVEIDEANRLYTVRLENASRKRSISDVRFLIQCEGSSACLDPTAQATDIIDVPPTYSAGSPLIDSNSMQINLNIAAGGEFGMRAKMLPGTPPPKFYFVLSSEKPSDIFILDATTLRGRFVAHYTSIVAGSFAFLSAVFLLLIAWLVVRARRARAAAQPAPVPLSSQPTAEHLRGPA